MNYYKLANANAHKITITTTATSLVDLLRSAASATNNLPSSVNGIDLVVEGGDIRYLQDNTPTTSVGMLVKDGTTLHLRNANLKTLYFISTSGSITANVMVGISAKGETSSSTKSSTADGLWTDNGSELSPVNSRDIEIGAHYVYGYGLKSTTVPTSYYIIPQSVSRLNILKVVTNLDVSGQVKIGLGSKNDGVIYSDAIEVQTTDATPTTLGSVTLLDENTYLLSCNIIGVKSDGTDRAVYHIEAGFYRTAGGGATIIGSQTTVHTAESDSTWDANFVANGNDVEVQVTGAAATTIQWTGHIIYSNSSN